MNWKQELKSIHYPRLLLGAALGAIGGYAYYHYVGCQNGTCAITSDPLNSTLYGLFVGVLFLYKKKKGSYQTR